MSEALPPRPHLNVLKNRAKDYLAEMRTKKPGAKLAEAQLAIARRYGFSSWRAMVSHVESQRDDAARFLQAVAAGDVKTVRELLQNDVALIKATDDRGWTALHHAVWGSDPLTPERLRTLDEILKHKPDLETRTRQSSLGECTALHLAAFTMTDRLPAVARLIKAGARVDVTCSEGNTTPLYDAARHGAIDIAETLIAAGAKPAFLDWVAMDRGDEARVLLKDDPMLALQKSAYNKVSAIGHARSDAMRQLLMSHGAKPSLHEAAQLNWVDQLTQLLDASPNQVNLRDHRGQTPLHAAVDWRAMDAAKLLLSRGADPTMKWTPGTGWTVFELAKTRGFQPMIKLLAKPAPKSSKTKKQKVDWKPIMDAAFVGDAAKVKRLLDAGADPNVLSPTNHRHRPLHRAIEFKKTTPKTPGHEEVIRELLDHGADPALRGTHMRGTALVLSAIGDTRFIPILLKHFEPLDIFHASVLGDDRRVAQLLKKDRKLASAQDENGWFPLHYCAASTLHAEGKSKSLAKVAQLLVDAGADVNAFWNYNDEWPLRPLYYACGWSNNASVAEILIKAGADPCDGESVYHAADEQHQECLDLIAKHVAPKKLAAECTMCLSTQLGWGASRGSAWLLEHGADPNMLDKRSGNSALHAAVLNSANDKVIDNLLSHGADPKLKNREGKTAIQLAKSLKSDRVLKKLTAGKR